jgi:hypothetical protein
VLARVVTTVWGTRLGARLLYGLNSTTEETAYFALSVASFRITDVDRRAKFLSRMAPGYAGKLFL